MFCYRSFCINSIFVAWLLRVSSRPKYAHVPMATIAIKLATVFIGICTAADSEIFRAINYLLNLDTIHSHAALILCQTLQQIALHLFIMFFLLIFIEELISVFCFPLTCVLYVPFRCLHFPIWDIIFDRK